MKKITVDDIRNIMVRNRLASDLPDENLEEKTLKKDLKMDSLDMTELSMVIEHLWGIPFPEMIWDKWKRNLSSLTVKQVIDDWNAYIADK